MTYMPCYISPMLEKDYKKLAFDMGERLGTAKAHSLLTGQGVSPSTATKLLAGSYPSEIGLLLGSAVVRAERASRKQAS